MHRCNVAPVTIDHRELTRLTDRRTWVNRTTIGIAVALGWFVIVLMIGAQGDLSAPASRMLAIFGAAVVLWITEAIPLSATSILVILAEILLISDEAIVGLPANFEAPTYQSIFATLASPVLMLFLGGFVLADTAAKYRLDRNLAGVLLRPFGNSPRAILAGLMAITAVLSMFVSNTATTAAMMAVVLPVAAGLEPDRPSSGRPHPLGSRRRQRRRVGHPGRIAAERDCAGATPGPGHRGRLPEVDGTGGAGCVDRPRRSPGSC